MTSLSSISKLVGVSLELIASPSNKNRMVDWFAPICLQYTPRDAWSVYVTHTRSTTLVRCGSSRLLGGARVKRRGGGCRVARTVCSTHATYREDESSHRTGHLPAVRVHQLAWEPREQKESIRSSLSYTLQGNRKNLSSVFSTYNARTCILP